MLSAASSVHLSPRQLSRSDNCGHGDKAHGSAPGGSEVERRSTGDGVGERALELVGWEVWWAAGGEPLRGAEGRQFACVPLPPTLPPLLTRPGKLMRQSKLLKGTTLQPPQELPQKEIEPPELSARQSTR